MDASAATIDALYNDAVQGNIKAFESLEELDRLLTPIDNTILHIHITARTQTVESVKFVQYILEKCQDLLWKVNNKGETLLHIAARYGHDDLVQVLLAESDQSCKDDEEKGGRGAKEMVGMKNNLKETALHEAARYNHLEVVKRLIKEDLNLLYVANYAGETPLYLATERGFDKVVSAALEKQCLASAANGSKGRTILHAAVLRSDKEMTALILEKCKVTEEKMVLLKMPDQEGWIPLHYAVSSNSEDIEIVTKLLDADSEKSLAYITTKNQMTALHVAAMRGKVETIKLLISHYPGCCELVDERGWNVLHFAVESKNERAIEFLLDKENGSLKNLINEKNAEGKTPLDLAASVACMKPFKDNANVDKLALEQKKVVIVHKPLFKKGTPKIEQTDSAITASPQKMGSASKAEDENESAMEKPKENEKQEDNSIPEEAKEAHLVVAALIATVTFTAGFTVPGGYINEKGPTQGDATLTNRVAFQAFIITNTIALALSTSAVLAHLNMTLTRSTNLFFEHESLLITIALLSMVIAFVTGTYSTLADAKALAIAACVVGVVLFAFNGSAYLPD